MTAVALIGHGGIAQDVVTALREIGSPVKVVGAMCRPGRVQQAAKALGDIPIVETRDRLILLRPTVVAEVAGQQAVTEHAEGILRDGIDFMVISIGALADPKLLERLKIAACDGGSHILLPAGAVGGIEPIAAMRVGGLHMVRYCSRKPPAAWRGSPAEKAVDLDKLPGRTVLYRGSAGEATLLYPQNANVAAAVALAGLGFDATEVELVADPEAPGNVHEIEAEGVAGRFAIQLRGKASKTNPKTSALAALSVARALNNLQSSIVI